MDTIGVSQTDFLSGEISMTFDLEKAGAVCKTLPKYMNGACPCKEEAEAAKMLIKALPEIRRLQEFRDRVARILKQPLTDCDDLLILSLDSVICHRGRQAAEIERLREALDESERVVAHKTESAAHWYDEHLQARADRVQTRRVVEQQAARIKALEDALVEERVIGEGGFRAEQCEFWYIEDLPEESCMELDGPCDWAKCPRKHELCDVAYQQLAEEGKIGPDDSKKISHLRPYEVVAADLAGMLAKSWQITDERKAAIKELSELLTAIGCPSCHYYIKKNYGEDITVLRAMLEEAEQ